jgi:hypothetical protein
MTGLLIVGVKTKASIIFNFMSVEETSSAELRKCYV